MKKLYTTLFSALIPVSLALAAPGYVASAPQGVSVGVSKSGTTVFGYNDRAGEGALSTWLFDVASKESSQFTSYSEADPDKGGQVMWQNAAGTRVGTIRDFEWVAPEVVGSPDPIYNEPLYTACIWKDGKMIKLDHNKWTDAADFKGREGDLPSPGNGFVATFITDDESLVLGYLKAFTYMLPVKWVRQSDGTYKSQMMPRWEGLFLYRWVGASADGSMVVMNDKQSGGQSYVWINDADPVLFSYAEAASSISEPCLTALSHSGRYGLMECMRDQETAHAVYDLKTGEAAWIPLPQDAASSTWFDASVVTDNHDGFICDYNYRLHYFNTELGINIPFLSYLEAFGDAMPDNLPEALAKAKVRMVSPDGRVICGNTLQSSLEQSGWIVSLPDSNPILFALKNCQVMYSSPSRLLLRWEDSPLPAGTTLKNYEVVVDDAAPVAVEATKGDDGMMRAYIDATPGQHTVTVYAVVLDGNGKTWESVHSTKTVSVSAKTSLLFFEDLDDSEIDSSVMAYIYMHDTFKPVPSLNSGTLSFRLDAGDFYNLTPYWYTCSFDASPWNSYMESRWFDASAAEADFYFVWHERNRTLNTATSLSPNNLLSLEYTVDGENWLPLSESNGAANDDKWNIQVVNLSDKLAGKCFRLRFHASGIGDLPCEWRVDNYGIISADQLYDAPRGLMAVDEKDGAVTLAWKNNRDEYEVSYNFNSPMTYNSNLGNEGKPFYVACDFGPDKFKAFEGKYITSVATMLYEPDTVEQAYHTTVQAVVFDSEGNELSRGTLPADAPWYEEGVYDVMPIHHIPLDTAVKIEPGKTYRVSILITDYETAMCPIWYFSASDDYIPGVTDLYSDDNLKTWNSYSNLYKSLAESDDDFDKYGRCIFNIRPGISDSAEISAVPYEQTQRFYQVLRNGAVAPHGVAFYTQQTVVDAPNATVDYTVRSFRTDGSFSRLSEPVSFTPAAVESIEGDPREAVAFLRSGNNIEVIGDFDSVSVYDVHGHRVARSARVDTSVLPRGLYIFVVEKEGRSESYKIVF